MSERGDLGNQESAQQGLADGSLDALGTQIEAAHQAAHREARSAVEHALRCGELLVEAKAAVEHGGWLDWLSGHTTMTPRQSQRYMRLAQHREALAEKCDTGTHLTLRAALAALAEPQEAEPTPEEDVWGWAEAQLTGPFTAQDLDEGDNGWITTKLLHHLRVPAFAALCLNLADAFKMPALRLVPAEALVEALRLLAPYAATAGDAPALPLDTRGMSAKTQFGAGFVLKLTAQRALCMFFEELEDREDKTDDELLREWDTVHAKLLRRIDKELKRIESRREECHS